MLTFEADHHEYRWHGEIVPSVTSILKHAGQISEFCMQEFAAQRGTQIHAACALLALDNLDWSTIDARILGYVLSYAEFLKTAGWKIESVEQQRYCPILKIAGTYDLLAEGWITDLKSGAPARWHKYQLALYHRLAGLDFKTRRATLYLQADGRVAKLVEHKNRSDFAEALKLVEDYYGQS